MTLPKFDDTVIRTAAPKVAMERKWSPSEAIQGAKSVLHFRDVVDQVQQWRARLGLIPKAPQWHKATSEQRDDSWWRR